MTTDVDTSRVGHNDGSPSPPLTGYLPLLAHQGNGSGAGAPLTLYDVIYADPPWCYENRCPSGNVHEQYDTMDDDDICGLCPPAAKRAVLYLWATAPRLPTALDVMLAWGFAYKSCAIWDKKRTGIGYWFLGQHEILMVGTRGNVSPPVPTLRISSVIRCGRGRHSAKPEYVRDMIEKWFPNAKRLEMFSRLKRPGWDVFGNQVEHDLLSGAVAPAPEEGDN